MRCVDTFYIDARIKQENLWQDFVGKSWDLPCECASIAFTSVVQHNLLRLIPDKKHLLRFKVKILLD